MERTIAPASVRKGIAAILFRRKGDRLEFLITHRTLRWHGWETLKGGVQPSETNTQALFREILEELDIDRKHAKPLGIVPGSKIFFKVPVRFREQMGGFAYAHYEPFYLVEIAPETKTNLRKDFAKEHDEIRFVPYSGALRLLTYSNVRAALRRAKRMIEKKN